MKMFKQSLVLLLAFSACVSPAKIVGLRDRIRNSADGSGTNGRIVGGEPAARFLYRFVAAIWLSTSTGTYFCGGSILSEFWVLTAGQCVYDVKTFRIQIGSNVLNDPDSTTLASSEFVAYPEFDPLTFQHDIGAIRLRFPIQFSDWITPIHLLPTDETNPNTLLGSLGWGQTSDSNSDLSSTLLIAPVTAISNQNCETIFTGQIKDSMICTVGSYNQGICQGDTGSPLTHFLKTGHQMLVGVASFLSGNGCESLDPSGYTRVFPYNEWLIGLTDATVEPTTVAAV